MSMLTGMKVSSLAYKCIFYRPEHDAKGRWGSGKGTEFLRSWNGKVKYTNG